jgi:ATP phosphoribosyltransferase regulatory subunit
MTELERKALLPAGLRDVLPPDAAFEAAAVERLMAYFAARGYDRVKPPLIEFEDGLLSGAGVAVASDTFRLMDPVSQRMMGLRADITPQIARIARTRLAVEPRPLRLSYAGEVLRVRGTQLRPERQLTQVGAELIGVASTAADAEIVATAAGALQAIGVAGLSVDLTVPRLVRSVFEAHALDGETAAAVRAALDHKDPELVAARSGSVSTGAAPTLTALLQATGPADKALARLAAIELPAAAADMRAQLAEVVGLVRAAAPSLRLTVDPVEHRGFEYHTGVGFTIFARGAGTELGSGGSYHVRNGDEEAGERATGVTLYVEAALAVLEPAARPCRVLLPAGTPHDVAERLRGDGWITVAALDRGIDAAAEARRLGCGHVLDGGRLRAL